MSIACANAGIAEPQLRAALNARADSAAMELGDVVQFTTAKDGITCFQPVTLGLFSDCAGVLNSGLAFGDQRNNLVVEGVIPVKFLNHASAAIGTYAKPVTGQDYMTYSALPTRYVLQTTQTSGTSVHKPANEASPPKILILASNRKTVRTLTVSIPNLASASSSWVVCPEAGTIIGADLVTNAIVSANSPAVTFKLEGTVITTMAISVTKSQAAGTVFSAAAPTALNYVAASKAIEVVNDGNGTNTTIATVSIYYLPN